MKKLLFAFVMLFSLPVMAQQGLQMPTNVSSNSNTAATAGATNQGVNLGVNSYNYSDGETKTTLKTTPGLGGQAFYGSYSSDSCRQSTGGGGVIPSFGINIVTPSTDEHCQAMREFERTMQGANYDADKEIQIKMRQAARDIMCQTSGRLRAAYTEQGLCSPRFAEQKDAALTAQQQDAQRLPPPPMYQ